MAWLRLYDDILADPKVLMLGPEVFQTWILYLCAYKKYGGKMPDKEQLAFLLRLAPDVLEKHIQRMAAVRLVEMDGETARPHNWDKFQYESDSSRARMKKLRDKGNPSDVTEVDRHGDGHSPSRVTTSRRHGDGHVTVGTVTSTPSHHRHDAVTVTAPDTDTETDTDTDKKRVSFFDLETAFEEIWEAYPAKGRTRKPMSQQYYVEAVATLPDDQQAAMHAKILTPLLPGGKWANSAQWAKGFVQGLPVYLNQMQWLESPEPAVKESYTLDLREPEDDTPIVRGELPVFSDEEFAADIARMHSK